MIPDFKEAAMHQRRLFIAGLAVLGLLSVADLLAPLMTDGETPPMFIAVIGSVLGLISLVAIFGAHRGSRAALVVLLVIRSLSALTAMPAFFVPDVPAPARMAAGVGIGFTILGIALVLGGRRMAAEVR